MRFAWQDGKCCVGEIDLRQSSDCLGNLTLVLVVGLMTFIPGVEGAWKMQSDLHVKTIEEDW